MVAKLDSFVTKYKVRIILIVMILTVIIPILIYASKSFPVADDFGNTRYVRDSMVDGSYILTSLKITWDTYLTKGGLYFSAFINYLFTPLLRGGILGIRVFNPIAHIVFYICSYLLVHSFSKYILNADEGIALILYFAFIFNLANNRVNSEVYSWYTVMAMYILPIAIMMLSYAFLIFSFNSNNKMYIISAILSFLVSGSSLDITALNCGMLLLAVFFCFTVDKNKTGALITFVSAFIGALISAFAPGNFVRHGESEYYIIGSFKSSLICSAEQFIEIFTRTPFIIFFVIVFLILYIKTDYSKMERVRFNHPVLASVIVFGGVVLVNYPVFLGAGGLAERCEFVQDIAIYFLTFLWLVYFAGYLKRRYDKRVVLSFEGIIVLSISLVLYGIAILNYHGGSDSFTTPYMVKSIFDGRFSEYVQYNEGVIEILESSEGKDVIIYNPDNISNPYMKDMRIRPNDQAYTNQTMTRYYNLRSLRLYEEE